MSEYNDLVKVKIISYLKELDYLDTRMGIMFQSPTRKLRDMFREDGFPITSFLIGRRLRELGGKTKSTSRKGKTISGVEFKRDTIVFNQIVGENNEK